MTNLPEKADIRAAVNAYCEQRALSKADLATRLGISSATLSNVETGKWDRIDEKMWLKIWQEVGTAKAPAELVETANFGRIQRLCREAQQSRLMVGVVGDTGLGKSTALAHYARRPRVYYVAVNKAMKPRHFLEALLNETGVSFAGSVYDMMNRLASELNGQRSPLVIIDEAGKLTHQLYLLLHDLRENTQDNVGIVLAGMPYFRANLLKDLNRQREGAAEFYRRINIWLKLERPTRVEIKAVCEAHGVTDEEIVRAMQGHLSFGDLTNALLLAKLELESL